VAWEPADRTGFRIGAQGVHGLAGGRDSGVPEPVPNHLQVCAAGEQSGCVGVAQVVQACSGIEPGPAKAKECFDNLP
jgi:hypothetical protein